MHLNSLAHCWSALSPLQCGQQPCLLFRVSSPHLHGQQTLQALAVEVALHADDEAHAALRHLAGVEVAGVPVLLVFVLVIIPLDCTSRA